MNISELWKIFISKFDKMGATYLFEGKSKGFYFLSFTEPVYIGKTNGINPINLYGMLYRIMNKDTSLWKEFIAHPDEVDFLKQAKNLFFWGGFLMYVDTFWFGGIYDWQDILWNIEEVMSDAEWYLRDYIPNLKEYLNALPTCIGSNTYKAYKEVIKKIGGKERGLNPPCVNTILSIVANIQLYIPKVVLKKIEVDILAKIREEGFDKKDIEEMNKLWEEIVKFSEYRINKEDAKKILYATPLYKINEWNLNMFVAIHNRLRIGAISNINTGVEEEFLTPIGICKGNKWDCLRKPFGELPKSITG